MNSYFLSGCFFLGLPTRFARVGLCGGSLLARPLFPLVIELRLSALLSLFFAALKKARSGLRPPPTIPQPAALWACKTVYWTNNLPVSKGLIKDILNNLLVDFLYQICFYSRNIHISRKIGKAAKALLPIFGLICIVSKGNIELNR